MNNEQEMQVVRQRSASNLAVIANIVELTKQVVCRVVDDDVAESVSGGSTDAAFLGDLIVAKVGAQFAQQKGI